MNYRHAYHAGNFADVMKHVALILVMRHLAKKEKPFRVIDTHAGCGWYCLDSNAAERTGEWRDGVGRLLDAKSKLQALPGGDVIADYLSVVASAEKTIRTQVGADIMGRPVYPGSPAIAQSLLREHDRLHVNELHPDDSDLLRDYFARDRRVAVTRQNGWHVLKAALPPKERRGVILIDPPFEERGEFDRLADGLAASLQRFATGVVLLWYPMKDRAAVDRFYDRIRATAETAKEVLAAELALDEATSDGPLSATGLIVCNPPFRFAEVYGATLTTLADLLGHSAAAEASVRSL